MVKSHLKPLYKLKIKILKSLKVLVVVTIIIVKILIIIIIIIIDIYSWNGQILDLFPKNLWLG